VKKTAYLDLTAPKLSPQPTQPWHQTRLAHWGQDELAIVLTVALTAWLLPLLIVRLYINQGGFMSDTVGAAGDRIRSFVERIEQIDSELKDLNEAKKEVFSEAKGEGFDVKVLKEIIKLRKQDQEERDEHDTLLDVYMRAMDQEQPAQRAEAA
jgi:uncharacterized protein (UPF0335 family)